MTTTWRGPGWDRRAKAITTAARRDPNATCHYCGLPLGTGPLDADHTQPGNPTSPLTATHRACNRSAGASLGNTQRTQKTLRTTR